VVNSATTTDRSAARLELRGIEKSFGGVHALKNVSFDLQPHEVHALVGENGAGKSTLIRLITGAHAPDAGQIFIDGNQIQHLDPVRSRRLGVAAIYQQPALFPDLTVLENLTIDERSRGLMINWSDRRKRAQKLIDRIGASIPLDWETRRLSLPQQQLLEIARALGADSRILIMDEPTASLADTEVEHLFQVIRDLRDSGVGIIYISHRLEELPQIADRVTALRDGEVVGTHPMSEVTRSDLIRLMVGRELSSVFPKTEVPISDVRLELKGVSSRSAGVSGIDLRIRRGEILGLAGLVGAGRTELARVLFGIESLDSGEILLDGTKLRIQTPTDAISAGIAYVPEDRRRHGVVQEMSVSANSTLAILKEISSGGFLKKSAERSLAQKAVSQFGIKTASIDTPVNHLSGGNQQKVVLAKWLQQQPRVLILDEPTQGIDVGAKAEIHRMMCDLAQAGLAVILISSELPEILGMSDRIAVMREGRLVKVVDRAAATQEMLLELALGHQVAAGEATC